MASALPFDPAELMAASNVYELGSLLQITEPARGISIVVPVLDRTREDPLVLSNAAIEALGFGRPSSGRFSVEVIELQEPDVEFVGDCSIETAWVGDRVIPRCVGEGYATASSALAVSEP